MSIDDTNNSPAKVLAENRELLLGEVQKWITDIACRDMKDSPNLVVPTLLAGIMLRLGQLVNNQAVGANYYRITPIQLGNEGQKIIEKQQDGLVRTVLLVVDKGSGGQTPYIRVGTQKMNMVAGQQGSGGISLDAGRAHELGNVRPDTELWAASSVTIMAYTVEFA